MERRMTGKEQTVQVRCDEAVGEEQRAGRGSKPGTVAARFLRPGRLVFQP